MSNLCKCGCNRELPSPKFKWSKPRLFIAGHANAYNARKRVNKPAPERVHQKKCGFKKKTGYGCKFAFSQGEGAHISGERRF